MKKRLKHQATAALLAIALLGGSLFPSINGIASAAAGSGEWDPLTEWLPDNGQSFDPVQQALDQALSKNGTDAGRGANLVTNGENPTFSLPEEPVDVTTGALVLQEKDFSYDSYGPPLEVARSYTSQRPDQLSMFGYGWSIPQDRYIQLFNDFNMTDFQADGSSENYTFTKLANELDNLVDSYDGDELIYYPLDLGEYHAQNAANKKELTRRSAEDYLLVDPVNKMRYVFKGYRAPWRTNAPKDAGKLIRYADRTGLVILIDYDSEGRIAKFRTNTAA